MPVEQPAEDGSSQQRHDLKEIFGLNELHSHDIILHLKQNTIYQLHNKRSVSVCLWFKGRHSEKSGTRNSAKLSSRRRVYIYIYTCQQFRQLSWALAINDGETQGLKLVMYSLANRKPMQSAKKR